MFYHTEAKPQGWRALAIFEDGSEFLIFLGRSTTQVRAGYREAYMELLDEEERSQVQKISLQCWDGTPDRGRWVAKTTLTIPDRAKTAAREVVGQRTAIGLPAGGIPSPATDEDDDQTEAILPFRKPLAAAAQTDAPEEVEQGFKYVAQKA